MMKKLSKTLALLLALTMVLCLAACGGSKDALSGTWSADLGDDGVITWTFDGKGKCTMENSYMKQKGTYTIDGDQLTVGKLERSVYLHVLCGWQQPHHERKFRLRYQRNLHKKIAALCSVNFGGNYETNEDQTFVPASCGADAAQSHRLR